MFPFDPSRVSIEELRQLGLSPKVARTFVRFREKGGIFRNPEDLQKVYGMKPEDVQRLTPYVRFSKPGPEDSIGPPPVESPVAPKLVRIDINQASAKEWRQLYGIGPVLSDRITRFREKLGGFSSVEQVRETYGLPDSTFEKIHPSLLASSIFRPLAVNRLGWKELSQHPYLTRRQARAIVAYRQQHGRFSSPSDLDKVLALPRGVRAKLKPYWNFD